MASATSSGDGVQWLRRVAVAITLDLPAVATTVTGDPVQLWHWSSSTRLSVVSILMRRCTSGSIGWPTIHVTRDIRKGVAKVGDLRFRVLDSAGLERDAASDTILSLTTTMTWNVLTRSQFAIFLIDVRTVKELTCKKGSFYAHLVFDKILQWILSITW
ncbi:putative altered inheritance rate of mitochondria protein 25 [Iris pallida]|uniref:Altered inheritance rate of mitochondria protein 25 n=1 Tax=Iris pallida TaxID=29817 RepID=A0AAX6I4S6_IRIPA|nr:putative altered inheritance rate of mitochondria protein 25 [Iris pallida]